MATTVLRNAALRSSRRSGVIPRSPFASSSRSIASSSSFAGSSSGSGSGSGSGGRRFGRSLLFAVPATAGLLLMPTLSADTTTPTPSELVEGGQPLTPVKNSLVTATTGQLLRSYLVYTLISTPGIVDYSPHILHTLTHTSIPFVRHITEYFVRNTFFDQFVPGETVEECMTSMVDMRLRGIGSMLNYSAEAEVEENDEAGDAVGLKGEELARQQRLEEVLRALNKAGEFERSMSEEQRGSTGFALKITGLIDPAILQRASTTLLRLRPLTSSNSPSSPASQLTVPYPGTPQSTDARVVARDASFGSGKELFSLKGAVDAMGVLDSDEGTKEGDLEQLQDLWQKVKVIGQTAKDNSIKLFVDAEHTFYQPALDAYTILLSQEFNRPPKDKKAEWHGPLIYGTYQSYLVRQPGHLAAALAHAEKNGYALGIKLVRGAYFVQERKKWIDEGRPGADPIWPDKPATDVAYNNSINTVLTTLARQLTSSHPERALSVVFGTHNPDSCDLITEGLKSVGLVDEVADGRLRLRDGAKGRIGVAQLYGMKDDLTDRMAARFVYEGVPIAIKYIAYGKLSEVMPFLGRRAIENKSLMTGDQGAAAERRRIGGELKRRIFG
ncbi:hypothetical protein CI109_103396 [Kwoniella shandongensis]|uniref:Proline dehydrogenase n=1 Tax=Kwoniella shandongensis TaxID=1734106 RepID=A0A5M6C0R0_9TREE|nr:uncharacterized protein CI109_004477 [Kwoniella shandongensis]KAA5527185.1 hypothetical protein CI109_004477 [Kwoniella shandongensis]